MLAASAGNVGYIRCSEDDGRSEPARSWKPSGRGATDVNPRSCARVVYHDVVVAAEDDYAAGPTPHHGGQHAGNVGSGKLAGGISRGLVLPRRSCFRR
jgi:hypothetical protein